MKSPAKSLKNCDMIGNLFYFVTNFRFTEELEKNIQSDHGTFLGRIEYDTDVETYNLEGKSLLELPENSPAYLSVKNILAKAGYTRD